MIATVLGVGLAFVSRAQAELTHVHIVRQGENLASIAQLYYGDARREGVLVAENGLTTQGGTAIVIGMRLVIPYVSHHRVRVDESWAQLASRYYGDTRRATILIDANPQVSASAPDVDAELLVPYPLRHVARQNETMARIAQLYFGDEGEAARLIRFNGGGRGRLSRGQVVLVPLTDLLLSAEGRRQVEESTGQPGGGGELRAMQTRISEQLPSLREHVRRGRFAEAATLAGRLLGAGEVTREQRVSIESELAVAYVALDRADLATAAFTRALELDPDLELDARRASPTVRAALERARQRLAARRARAAAAADAGASPLDAGVPPSRP
jgi:LysM repeat protein